MGLTNEPKLYSKIAGREVLNVATSSTISNGLESADYLGFAYPNTTTEVITYKSGGSGGTTLGTITLIYLTDVKKDLASVERTS